MPCDACHAASRSRCFSACSPSSCRHRTATTRASKTSSSGCSKTGTTNTRLLTVRLVPMIAVSAAIGALSGVMIVIHRLFAPPLDPAIFVYAFAAVAILTGVMHILGGYQIRQHHGRRWARGSFFLGLFEILLGVLLLLSPQEVSPGVMIAAMAWSLIGGIGLITDALRLRKILMEEGPHDNKLK